MELSSLSTQLRFEESVILLTRSGWSIDRVGRITAEELKGVENARRASGPTPTSTPAGTRLRSAVDCLEYRREP